MVLDHLRHAEQYYILGPLFEQALRYMEQFNPETPDGHHSLQGDDLFVLVQTFHTALPRERTFEAHRRYTDIQFVHRGKETIYYQQDSTLQPKGPYDAARDVQLFDGEDNRPLLLGNGEFAIFWPQDGHKPGCHAGEIREVRKVVAKIRCA